MLIYPQHHGPPHCLGSSAFRGTSSNVILCYKIQQQKLLRRNRPCHTCPLAFDVCRAVARLCGPCLTQALGQPGSSREAPCSDSRHHWLLLFPPGLWRQPRLRRFLSLPERTKPPSSGKLHVTPLLFKTAVSRAGTL